MYDEPTDDVTDDVTDDPAERTVLRPLDAFLIGLATTLVLVLAWQLTNGNDDPSSSSVTLAETATSGGGPPDGTAHTHGSPDATADAATVAGAPLTTRMARCRAADAYLGDALDDARPALDQWSVHVGAMNKLVVGEITLKQATAFWNSTRVGAARRVAAFREVMAELRGHGLDCPSGHYLSPGSPALPGCVRRVAAEAQALGAARTSITTWEDHIEDMELLRSGDLSPEDATAAWLSIWQQGMRDLAAYDAAAKVVERQARCTRGAAAQ